MTKINDALKPLKNQPFHIMDGAGNDFVIADLRRTGNMTEEAARVLGDRSGPFGADQIISLISRGGVPAMEIRNADGSVSAACGNAARCIAHLLLNELEMETITFGSPAGPLHARRNSRGDIEVNMGPPRLAWDEIPLAEPAPDTRFVELPQALLEPSGLKAPSCVSMGNPHAVFFVEDADSADLRTFGPLIENHAAFPERVNVSVASLEGDGLRLRTWERGVGITKACGTAACAALVSAVRRNLLPRTATLRADGGLLDLTWEEATGDVFLAGPVGLHRSGTFDASSG
ncbi:MAG: diaminopimelate epimerase [Pseudomonadota bacterium]